MGEAAGKGHADPRALTDGAPASSKIEGWAGWWWGVRSGMRWGIGWGFERDHSVGGMRLGLDIWV